MQDFNRKTIKYHLQSSFKGLSKDYILDCMFDKDIQSKWKPQVGDIIVGPTGNIFVISGHHHLVEELGGDHFYFGGGPCSRDGSCIMDSTYCSILTKDGLNYKYTVNGIEKEEDFHYSKFSDFRYVPYPHER